MYKRSLIIVAVVAAAVMLFSAATVFGGNRQQRADIRYEPEKPDISSIALPDKETYMVPVLTWEGENGEFANKALPSQKFLPEPIKPVRKSGYYMGSALRKPHQFGSIRAPEPVQIWFTGYWTCNNDTHFAINNPNSIPSGGSHWIDEIDSSPCGGSFPNWISSGFWGATWTDYDGSPRKISTSLDTNTGTPSGINMPTYPCAFESARTGKPVEQVCGLPFDQADDKLREKLQKYGKYVNNDGQIVSISVDAINRYIAFINTWSFDYTIDSQEFIENPQAALDAYFEDWRIIKNHNIQVQNNHPRGIFDSAAYNYRYEEIKKKNAAEVARLEDYNARHQAFMEDKQRAQNQLRLSVWCMVDNSCVVHGYPGDY